MDMSLDDSTNTRRTIKSRSTGGGTLRQAGRQRSSASPYARPSRGNSNDQWSHDLFQEETPKHTSTTSRLGGRDTESAGRSSKIIVENLFYEVTEQDLRELFGQVGEIKKAFVHFDRTGRSTGVADITFASQEAAMAALKTYNGVSLDGQAMQVKFAPNQTSQVLQSASLSKRIGSGHTNVFSRLGEGGNNSSGRRTSAPSSRRGQSSNRADSNSTSRGGRRGKRTGEKRQIKSQEDLDAEMEAYMKSSEDVTMA